MIRTMQLFLILLLVSSSTFTGKDVPVYKDPQPGMFLREWLLCGPFPNPLPAGITEYRFDSTSLGHYRDYLMQYGGEGNIRPVEGMEVKHPDGYVVKWHHFKNPFGLIPLDEIITPNIQTIVYAACIVQSSEEKKMILSITSNDGIRIWQNGDRILEHNTAGSEEPDRDFVTVTLKKGDNRFLVKISQGFGKWSFQFRFLDYAKTIDQVKKSIYLYTRPEIIETANSYQIFVGQRYKVELLQKKIPATVRIMDRDAQHVVASYNTNLGETLEIKKSELKLIDGLHPISCSIILPDGKEHTLRNYLFVGKPPAIAETYKRFLQVPKPDTTFFHGKQAYNNSICMDIQLSGDVKAGNMEAMDSWTQWDVTTRYEKWRTAIESAVSPYHKIFPEIQNIELLSRGEFRMKNTMTFTDYTYGQVAADMERIQQSLKEKQNVNWAKSDNGDILLGLQKDFPEMAGYFFPNHEAYRILVDENKIKVIGAGIRGLHFGLVTLKHLFDMKVPFPSVNILDFPTASHRATFHLLQLPLTQKNKARIQEYVDLKYNEIFIRSSDFRNIGDPKIREGIEEYFDFIKRFHIEPIPLIWLGSDPSWQEGVLLDNEPIIFNGDRVDLNFQQLVNLKSSRPVLRSNNKGGIVYELDKDYKIVSVAPPVIERIKSGRIPTNTTVYLTGDITDRRAHRFTKACPSEEMVYEEFDRLAGLVIKILKPKILNVNHDELGLVNSDSRCRKRNMKDHELVAYQINRMRDIVKKHNPTTDIIMWADCINPFHNAGLKSLENTGELLFKDILMAHWFYSAENYHQRDIMEMGTTYLLNKGFRTYGSPWDHLVNHQAWENILLSNQSNPNFMGLMHTEWSMQTDERTHGLSQTAEINWTGRTWLTR